MSAKDQEFEKIDGIRVPKATKIDKESPGRTLAKTISWRIVASLTTFVIFYFTAGHKIAIEVISAAVGIEVVAKMVIYFLHERAWANIHWGKYWVKNKMVRRVKLYYIRKRRLRNSQKY